MGYYLAHLIARIIGLPVLLLWRLSGWRAKGGLPDNDKLILIAAPHTSNWDYVAMFALAAHVRRRPQTLLKASATQWPIVGTLLRWLGAIPIDRSKSNNAVQQAADLIKARDRVVLVIAPEGTRKRADHWRSGFYHIAVAADVPIVLGYLDYKNKIGAAGPTLYPTGDIDADMQIIKDFYDEHGYGKYPDNASPARVRSSS